VEHEADHGRQQHGCEREPGDIGELARDGVVKAWLEQPVVDDEQ
jgi:hypothetical protein